MVWHVFWQFQDAKHTSSKHSFIFFQPNIESQNWITTHILESFEKCPYMWNTAEKKCILEVLLNLCIYFIIFNPSIHQTDLILYFSSLMKEKNPQCIIFHPLMWYLQFLYFLFDLKQLSLLRLLSAFFCFVS